MSILLVILNASLLSDLTAHAETETEPSGVAINLSSSYLDLTKVCAVVVGAASMVLWWSNDRKNVEIRIAVLEQSNVSLQQTLSKLTDMTDELRQQHMDHVSNHHDR